MRNRFRIFLIVPALLALSSSAAASFEVRYNGSMLSVPIMAELYPVPSGAKGEQGISLADVFPPQINAWMLETGAEDIASDDLGERLFDIFLVPTRTGWDLVMDAAESGSRKRIKGIRKLFLRGDPCMEKNIEVWLSWEGVPELKSELQAWATRAGISIKILETPSIASKLIAVARGGGKTPDVIMVQSDYMGELSSAGLLQELDELALPANAIKGRASFTLGGRALAAPFYCDTQLVFYSTDLIRSAPPGNWTLGDMERLARASGAEVRAAWNAFSAYWFLPFVLGFGKATIVDDSGKMGLSDPAYAKALAWTKNAIDSGFLAPMERDAMMAYFTSGKAAFILSGSYSIPEFKRLGIHFGVAPYPLTATGGKGLAPLIDYKAFAVTRATKSPVLSRRLLQRLSDPALQARFCASQGKLPANSDAWPMLPQEDPYLAALRASYDSGIAVPAQPAYGVFKKAMWKLLRLYLGGSMTLEETIAAARKIMGE